MTERQRRPSGDGGVRWSEGRQRYIAEQTVGYDARGKRIVKTGSGKSEAAALKALRQRVKDHEAGLATRSELYKIGQAVEDWLEHGQGDIDEETRKRNRILADTHVIPRLGGRKVRELRPEEIDDWLTDLSAILATSTLRRVRWLLSRAVTRAVRRGLAERNVVDLCEVPRVDLAASRSR